MLNKIAFALAILIAAGASGASAATRSKGVAAWKAVRCFDYSEANNLSARLRLIWIPRATPCRPAIQGFNPE
jgi:hypothetical protein